MPPSDRDLADLADEEQVELIEPTDNGLKPADRLLEQPPQDPDWRPDPDDVVDSI